jgi:fucose permease
VNLRARIYLPLIGFLVAGPALFTSATTHVLALAICCLIVFGVAKGFADANIMPILCQIVDPRYRATGYGVMNFMGCIVGGLMTLAAGAVNDATSDLTIVFQCAAVVVVVAVLLMLLIRPRIELEEK